MAFLESHLVALILFSLFTSVAMATLAENDPRSRVIASVRMFAAFVLSTLVGAWVLHFIR